jgi:hypothetical protein
MPPDGFEPAVPAGKRLQTYASDRAATGIGRNSTHSAVMPLYEYSSCIETAWIFKFCPPVLVMAYAVGQLVQAMRCKPEGRGYDWDFSFITSIAGNYGLTKILR